jgi:AraC-like DNA-binding protein
MDKFSFLNITASIAFFILLLLAFFLLTVKTKNKLANRLFASYLILFAIAISGFFIYDYIINNFVSLEIFRWTSFLFIMPSFYLYVLAVCYTDFRLKPKHLLHTAPFVLLNLVLAPKLFLANSTEKKYYFEHIKQMPELYFSHILFAIQFAFSIIGVFLILKKYRKIYLENYANPNNSIYKWLFQMTLFFLIFYCLVIFKNLLIYTHYNELFIWANVILCTIFLLITCWFILKALNHPEIFRGIDSQLQLAKDIVKEPETNTNPEQPKYNQDTIITTQIALLKKYMIDQEPYLEPSLTIQELANQINMPVRDLSVLINHHMDQHFFDFVNEYRVQKAMGILKNDSKNHLTVLEILYEVGFNSKSSFNTSFKKHTQLTPTAYRNNSL